jgi:hypothetical protein
MYDVSEGTYFVGPLHIYRTKFRSASVLRDKEDVGSMVLHNIGILPHHHMVSQPENGGSKVL